MIGRKLFQPWMRVLMLVTGIGAACLLLSPQGYAQLTNYQTVVSFNVPVEVPGSDPQVLPAGSYTFKVVDSKVNRNIVQISNKDDNHVYTTVLTIPTHREIETDKTVMTFEERAAGQPQALRAWFYPHEKSGQEFVYSKSRAQELAKSSKTPIPYSDSASNTNSPAATGVPVAEASPAPILLMQSNGQSTQSGQPYTQIAQAEPPRTVAERNASPSPTPTAALPQTASNTPLYLLIGCVMIAGGLSLKSFKRSCGR